MEANKLKIVYTIVERGEKSFWVRVGVAYTNRDGSLNVKLDAVPVNGTLQIREWTPKDDQPGPSEGARRSNGGRPPMEAMEELPDAFS